MIAILGTRGIPNNHGGFEQFAEYLTIYMEKLGIQCYVYSTHNHPYKEDNYKGVKIVHKYNPEVLLGTFGQFLYDLFCIIDIRKRNPKIVLQLGYTSSSIWNWIIPKKIKIFTNMDGLEWKRSKYNNLTKSFLLFAEKLAIKKSDYLISDSLGIQKYIEEKYTKKSFYIAYGANIFNTPDIRILNNILLKDYNLEPFNYDLIIARIEPENNILMIIKSFIKSNSSRKMVIVGKKNTKFYNYIKMYETDQIIFIDAIYDINILNNLRYFSELYFHGHSVGGTNPSLLEAMASSALIIAHDNIFNKSILKDNAFYFNNETELVNLIKSIKKKNYNSLIKNNINKIKKYYNWEKVCETYYNLLVK